MERRGHNSGQVTHVKCRACNALVLLDPAKMVAKATHAEMKCPICGAGVPVRRSDIDKPPPEGIWTIACYAEDAAPETAEEEAKGLGRLLHRR